MRQLFGALVLAGCWTGAAVAPPPPSAPDELPDPPAPFDRVAGRWEGIARQHADELDWEIVVRLHARAAIGEPIGAIAYPSLGCSGLLIRTRERAGTYTVQERLLENPEDRCLDGGSIQFRRRAATLEWRGFDADGNESVASVLTRAR